jgi:Protein of unknown function (DUF4239)
LLLIKVLIVILTITLAISGLMVLVRKWLGFSDRFRDRIQSPPFGFFATLYAFFLGFAIVTLWNNFVTVKFNVTWEAYSLLSSYRLSQSLPNSDNFRKELKEYVKTVLDNEWSSMAQGSMNDKADHLIQEVWNRLQELKPADKQDNPIFINIVSSLNDARRQRLARATALSGNIYEPIWVIIIFGLIATTYSLYFMHPEPNAIQMIFEFMVLFIVLACIYFIIDLDTPFSGLVRVPPDSFREVYKEMLSLR